MGKPSPRWQNLRTLSQAERFGLYQNAAAPATPALSTVVNLSFTTEDTKEERKGFLQVFFVSSVSFMVDSFLTRGKRDLCQA